MDTINKYKIYKGIQKEIRFLLLERTIAIQFLGVTIAAIGFILILLGASSLSFSLCIALLIGLYSLFKIKDKRNQKNNIKKMEINKRKPDIIRTREMILIKNKSVLNDNR